MTKMSCYKLTATVLPVAHTPAEYLCLVCCQDGRETAVFLWICTIWSDEVDGCDEDGSVKGEDHKCQK